MGRARARLGRCTVIGVALASVLAVVAPGRAQDVVAARTLRAGTVLTEADLRLRDGAPRDEKDLAALVGLETRRAIYAGRPVVAADLGPPTLVRRNAVVVMTYNDGALGIRTEGRALEAGGAGEAVSVLNLTSRQSVRAVVTGPNRVEVRR